MKITAYVECATDVTVDIGTEDIRRALGEAFASRNPHDINGSLNTVGQFLNAFTDGQISALSPAVREIVHQFLANASERFRSRPVEGGIEAE